MEESKKTTKALSEFRNPYSCAQTVYAAYAENPDESIMADMKTMSGGRAPNNMCGALFAAEKLLPADRMADAEKIFANATGSIKCSEIKGIHKTPCQVCVKTACEILEKFGVK